MTPQARISLKALLQDLFVTPTNFHMEVITGPFTDLRPFLIVGTTPIAPDIFFGSSIDVIYARCDMEEFFTFITDLRPARAERIQEVACEFGLPSSRR